MTKLMVIAGEASGDLHGGNVLQELVKLDPNIKIVGTGGKLISGLATQLYYRVEDMAVIGFYEVLKKYSYYKGIFDSIVRKLDEEKPDVLLLVDFPGFNLKLAEVAKKKGIRVIYYIAPQVWAWKKGRIEKLKAFVDELIVLFPFEIDFFQAEGMQAKCFGHPLLDVVKTDGSKQEFFHRWNIDSEKKHICMLPGSRVNEINKHLPLLFATAKELHKKQSDLQFVIPLAPTVSSDVIEPFMRTSNVNIRLITGDTYNAVANSTFAMVASGTATLETAILKTPQVIFYKSSLVTYIIGKYLLRIKAIGLPNIIAGNLLVPENPHFTHPGKMAEMILHYLNDPHEYEVLKQNLATIKSSLGEYGAYRNTAAFIHSVL